MRCPIPRCATTSPAAPGDPGEAGRAAERGFVPQVHLPGAEAEVDFADLWIDLGGVRTKIFLFTLRLSNSGKAVHKAFASQGQEAFLDGHQHAFDQLGGIPFEQIRYDNLKSAVSRVLFGRNRAESDRWALFGSHMGFDPFYCIPGKEGAHEKGGVEGEGGRFRCTHLVPVPRADLLVELNALLLAADRADDHGGSPTGSERWVRTSRWRHRCCGRCRVSGLRPG